MIQDFLTNTAKRFPDTNAIWFQKNWISYEKLNHRSDKFAGYLVKHGVEPGDRIAIVSENSHDYAIAYYGILKAGAVTVELNTRTPSQGLAELLEHSGCRVVICSKRCIPSVVPAIHSTPAIELLIVDSTVSPNHCAAIKGTVCRIDEIYASDHSLPPPGRQIDLDLASIVYTSGSTGHPKGVMHSHLNVVSNTRSIVDYLKVTETDRMMVVLPFYYVYGKTLLNTHVAAGGSLVVDNRFTYPNVVLDTMKQTEVTGFAGVPATFSMLLGKSNIGEYRFPALRYVTQAGGHMTVTLQKKVANVFAPADLYIMYGATELSPRLTYVPPHMLSKKWGSIGIPIPNTDAFVVDEKGNRAGPHKEGEIAGRGSNVMMGYWKDPEATSRVLRNGMYFTGDLGRMDEDGYLYVTGRTKEMMKIKGHRVSAKEIEEALLNIGGIEEVAVVAVPDEMLGEAPRAFVVAQQGREPREEVLRAALMRTLAPYKIPARIIFRTALPKNESGKIMKHCLTDNPGPTVSGSGAA